MGNSIKDVLADKDVLKHVILPREIDYLLSSLEVIGFQMDQVSGIITGDARLTKDMSQNPIPGFDFALALPTNLVDSVPYKIKLTPADSSTSFQVWINLAAQGQVTPFFKFVGGIPGLALTGVKINRKADGTVSLDTLPDDSDNPNHTPFLVSRSSEDGAALGPALLISGSVGELASIRFTPDTDSNEGVVEFGLEPSAVMFGNSKIVFDCPDVVIDDSEEAKAEGNGAPSLDPPCSMISADTDTWRGILARKLTFYLPEDVPLFGGRPINGYLEIGREEGAKLVINTKVPALPATTERSGVPGYSIRIECIDPTAKGLSGLLPTLILATMELPLSGAQAGFEDENGRNQDITFSAGKPVKMTATFARDPVNKPDEFKIAIGISAQGQDGLISVKSEAMGGAKIFNTVAAMATALIAEKDRNIAHDAIVGNNPHGVFLDNLVAVGTVLSSLFKDDSSFVLHGVEIESSGHGAPVGGPVVLTLDYSVAVRVVKIGLENVLEIEMKDNQPMRIRVRRVRMSVDPSKSGLSMIGLDFDRAEMEIENPGAWDVKGLDSLFDVLGSRSGRGSSWIEVDLRFKLNLGPIKVSGATIRATLNNGIEASIRGLEAGLSIPGAIEGKGRLKLIKENENEGDENESKGFEADLQVKLLPLNVNADAGIIYAPPMILLRLNVDLPAPVPIANSGLGLFGIGGLFGLSAEPKYEQPNITVESDPVLRQLQWQPKGPKCFKKASGLSTFGFNAVVGTLPDFGFSFSAKAGLLITVPDIAVRGALNGHVMHPVVKLSDPSLPQEQDLGTSFLGFIGIDSEALSFGVLGRVNLKPLLEINVPLAGHFPFGKNADDWYIYLGADGAPIKNEGRSIGPITATVLPDILGIGADAYIMMRGKGITAWPHGRALPGGPLTLKEGFVLAFGFSLQSTFGVKKIVWADLYASLDLMIGAKPPTLAGFGRAGGSLNLGPFSLGVQAQVNFMARENEKYFWAEVRGRIELLFFDIEGKVTISFNNPPPLTLPDADMHPLDRLNAEGVREGSLGFLIDDSYRVLAPLIEDHSQITPEMWVWPDAIVSLPFLIPPKIEEPDPASDSDPFAQFPGVRGPRKPQHTKIGSEMLYYEWRLDKLELVDVTNEADPKTGQGIKPDGQLSACWQVPRGVTQGDDVSELVLFSKSNAIWVNRLADAGENMPSKPLKQAANICNRQVVPEAGWAIGMLANQESYGFRLPPELVSQNPLVSRVEARMYHFGVTSDFFLIPLDEMFTLPQLLSIDVASLIAWSQPKEIKYEEIKHEFFGHIVAPNLRRIWVEENIMDPFFEMEQFFGQAITLDLTESIAEGILLIIASPELFDRHDPYGLRVRDNYENEWRREPELFEVPTGKIVAFYRAPTQAAISQLRIDYPLDSHLGVVGIGGITVSANDAAVAEYKAIEKEIALLNDAAEKGPKTEKPNFPHQRAILDPGRLYRIDIDMVWSGYMFEQDKSGKIVPIPCEKGGCKTDQTLYKPKGSTEQKLTKRSLFFKTTPKPEADNPMKHSGGYASWLYKRQDVFQPKMIERYLSGYEPSQSEEFRFCDDPLRAHFTQDHVSALAKAYGFTILVDVERVDKPKPPGSPLPIMQEWSFATNPLFLRDADKLRYDYAVASNCNMPKPGATLTVKLPTEFVLEPEAWYNIHVRAEADSDLIFFDGHLPGVTFRTSRWCKPLKMFAGLGFSTVDEPEPPETVGDLVIALPTTLFDSAVIEGDDQEFQNALLAMGIEGWPASNEPRLSRLWVSSDSGDWLFAGLMVESPEPIHRPGRVDLNGLTHNIPGSNINFNIHRWDRSGSRLIYLTDRPFDVPDISNGFHLVLGAKETLDNVSKDISGSLFIPKVPKFSEDP